jgi:hypothetical protein
MQLTADLYVNDIVTDTLDFLRIGTEFQDLGGYDETRAVKVLNEILAAMSANGSSLPFFYAYDFTTTAGKSKYYIGQGPLADANQPYLVDVAFINLFYSELCYNVEIINDLQAFLTARATNIQFLPAQARVYLEQDSLGNTYTVVDFLYPPDQAYLVTLRAKPQLTQIGPTSTIVGLPMYYRSYLKYELARKLIPYYGREDVWTPFVEKDYTEIKETILGSVKKDLSVITGPALLSSNAGYVWRLGVRK